ncbi:acylphosphatase-2 isoform X5 [Vulpes vulpes]|uniref:Acylphosphatase n=1 Tax=Vulpes vulpes TaxID=9627 RepID=A0ABM4Z6U8_VULVU
MRARPPPAAAAAAAACRAPLRLLRTGLAAAMSAARPLKSVDYEVFGRVQGVCFRMYTEDEAKKIGVVGWVKNTSKGTVTGQVQGPEEKVNSISRVFCGVGRMSWLSKVGSPSSRIDRTNFSNEKTISKLEYSNFSIRY